MHRIMGTRYYLAPRFSKFMLASVLLRQISITPKPLHGCSTQQDDTGYSRYSDASCIFHGHLVFLLRAAQVKSLVGWPKPVKFPFPFCMKLLLPCLARAHVYRAESGHMGLPCASYSCPMTFCNRQSSVLTHSHARYHDISKNRL